MWKSIQARFKFNKVYAKNIYFYLLKQNHSVCGRLSAVCLPNNVSPYDLLYIREFCVCSRPSSNNELPSRLPDTISAE